MGDLGDQGRMTTPALISIAVTVTLVARVLVFWDEL